MGTRDRQSLDIENSSFWNELCGSALARSLGVVDCSPASLKRFDDWYMEFYPYLSTHIPFGELAGKDVLEISLGYGTVSQKLAEAGARYCGLDIAPGPVDMVNHRLRQNGLTGEAVRGSVLDAPFPDGSFDAIITIGCLHHTGDMAGSIEQCHRMLRPGGLLVVMVYNAYSYRRWLREPVSTFRYLLRELAGYRGVVDARKAKERAAYDANTTGEAPPHTDWVSVRSLRHMCRKFDSFSARRENIAAERPFSWSSRDRLLTTFIPPLTGLDIYFRCQK